MYMARKDKKTNEIVGSLDPKYLVQKSDPLVLMRSVPFSLGELKILDTYISRINAYGINLCELSGIREAHQRNAR